MPHGGFSKLPLTELPHRLCTTRRCIGTEHTARWLLIGEIEGPPGGPPLLVANVALGCDACTQALDRGVAVGFTPQGITI
jgi:hypothetical protein